MNNAAVWLRTLDSILAKERPTIADVPLPMLVDAADRLQRAALAARVAAASAWKAWCDHVDLPYEVRDENVMRTAVADLPVSQRAAELDLRQKFAVHQGDWRELGGKTSHYWNHWSGTRGTELESFPSDADLNGAPIVTDPVDIPESPGRPAHRARMKYAAHPDGLVLQVQGLGADGWVPTGPARIIPSATELQRPVTGMLQLAAPAWRELAAQSSPPDHRLGVA